MLIYNINLLIVYITSFFSRYFSSQQKNSLISKILIYISFISLFAVSALRYNVGSDYQAYEDLFSRIESYDLNNSAYEFGYVLLNKMIYLISDNNQSIFIITSFVILFFIVITIFRYSNKLEVSMFLFITLYFYYSSFNIVRQYISIAIMFYATRYIFDRNFKIYVLCVIIALFFHTTAIFALPLYFLSDKKLNNKMLIISIIVTCIVLVLINPIFNIITVLFPKYAYYEGGVLFTSGSYRSIIVIGSIFFSTYLYRNKIIRKDEKNTLYINAMFIGLIVSILGIKSVLFIRIMSYFSIYSILLIPNFINSFEKKLKPLVYLLIINISYIYCYLLLSKNDGGVLPYIFRKVY